MRDITTLPKWAQETINNLEHQVRELTRALDGYERTSPNSRFVVEYLSNVRDASRDIPIPEDGLSGISVFPDKGDDKYRHAVRFSLNVHTPGWVRVEADQLEMRPGASNAILVRPAK